MTAVRLVTTTVLAVFVVTCDYDDIAGPPVGDTDAELELMAQAIMDRLSSNRSYRSYNLLSLARAVAAMELPPGAVLTELVFRDQGDGTAPEIIITGQTIVESEAPSDPDLTLADEPLVRIGMLDGPMEYIFGNVTGAIRLEDGSVVIADEQSYNVRRYDASGRHVWTSGRNGEGPGEYGGLRLLRGCPGATITVFDWHLNRITELDQDGEVTDTRALNVSGVNPYQEPACTPDGDLVFTPWPDSDLTVAAGEHHRWEMELSWARGDSVVTLRSGIPGTERTRYGNSDGPRTWGRTMVFAVTPTGVWYGSADDYELEHLDWTGGVTRIAQWSGPDLRVTRERLDSFRDAYLARYDTPEDRRRFERDNWPGIRDGLPDRFPAYEALLPLPDGSVWITTFAWRSPEKELHLLDADGVWIRRVTMPAGSTVLDAGPDWVLLGERGEFDVPTVALYGLVEGGGASRQ